MNLARLPRLLVPALPVLAAAILLSPRPTPAAPHLTELRGTVLGFDQGSSLIGFQSVVGVRQLVVTSRSRIIINGSPAQPQNLQNGDSGIARFRFDTQELFTLHVERVVRVRGKVVATSANRIDLRSQGALLGLTTDAQTRLSLEGIRLEDRAVLVGLGAKAIYETAGQQLALLELKAEGAVRKGTIAAVDGTENTLTLEGRSIAFSVHTAATIRRNGEEVELEELQVGDRVRLAGTRLPGGGFQVLAAEARGPAAALE